MWRNAAAVLAIVLGCVGAARAEGERPGDFDYYVAALSWSPNWCLLEGDRRGADQCDERHDFGWILHGVWPQSERGWPSYCRTNVRPPSRSMTKGMADIMGSGGLAWHQWKKHGTCSGLDARGYFEMSRKVYGMIERPAVLRKLPREMAIPARVVEDAFLEANPGLEADQITLTCRSGFIQEARVCLTKDLEFRRCGADVLRDCALSNARMAPIR